MHREEPAKEEITRKVKHSATAFSCIGHWLFVLIISVSASYQQRDRVVPATAVSSQGNAYQQVEEQQVRCHFKPYLMASHFFWPFWGF